MISRLETLDQVLVEHGFHPLSPWWRLELGRFLTSGRRRWIIRAGRRSGKSSTLCRLAVAQALWGEWSVPAGDVGVVAFVSVSRDEAAARIRTIAAILRALGLQFDERDGEIELHDRPVVFRVFACTARAVVGFTSICVVCDEAARWEARDSAANPAQEVVGSLSPTLATQPHGFLVLSSSAWSTDDFHAEQVDAGDTDHQIVSTGTSWECNPTLTEEQTHELEPDPRIWSREYGNSPGATVSAALDPDDVEACAGLHLQGFRSHPWLAIDASSLRGDAFAFMGGVVTPVPESAPSTAVPGPATNSAPQRWMPSRPTSPVPRSTLAFGRFGATSAKRRASSRPSCVGASASLRSLGTRPRKTKASSFCAACCGNVASLFPSTRHCCGNAATSKPT